jgi:hypothetical protein
MAPPVRHGVLALDGGAVDTALGGGLGLGALHVVEGGALEAETGAVPAAFLATVLSRLGEPRPELPAAVLPSAVLPRPGVSPSWRAVACKSPV